MNRIYPHTPNIKAARLKFTLILLALLFIGKYVKADVPCHLAINQQQATIDSLQQQLKTAQSIPYNQGYQEGYKQAKLEGFTADEIGNIIGIITMCLLILSAPAAMIVIALKND